MWKKLLITSLVICAVFCFLTVGAMAAENGNNGAGWVEVDGQWNYYYPETGEMATGVSRVPYPECAIFGRVYEPNAEDVSYYENKGQIFINKDSALFVFDENGVFQAHLNGIVMVDGKQSYARNGEIAWHIGLVEDAGEYYYFLGDTNDGGNRLAIGDIYVGRNTTELQLNLGKQYSFDGNGRLLQYDGIVEVSGQLRYYEKWQWMQGLGLTKVGENYVYVGSDGKLMVNDTVLLNRNFYGFPENNRFYFDSNGYMMIDGVHRVNNWHLCYFENGAMVTGRLVQLGDEYIYCVDLGNGFGWIAVNHYQYIGENNLGLEPGYYWFDENGYLLKYDGIVQINGAFYYFKDWRWVMEAGLHQVGDDLIYVRGSGKLMVNDQIYVQKEYDHALGGKGVFFRADENGLGYDGFYEKSTGWWKTTRYYDNGVMVRNRLFRIGDEYYYSVGDNVAKNRYVPVPENDLGVEPGYYWFDEEGRLLKYDGIVEMDDGLRYFEDWQWVRSGLVQLDDGYGYVSSTLDGTLIRDEWYFISGNDYGIPVGIYYFDENGLMDIPEPDPVKDGGYFEDGSWYYYENGAIAYAAGLVEYNGSWIYVRSNGVLATGSYWITNHNGLMEAGMYEFSEDGYLVGKK